MKTTFAAALCAAALGLLVVSPSAFAQQKTAAQCNDEWAADKAAIQASGKTKRVFVAECRGVPLPARPARAAGAVSPGKGQFTAEDEARATCPGEAVVWVNLRSGISHPNGTRSYGQTKQGAYMCEKASVDAGFHPAKTRAGTRAVTPAANAQGAT